MASGLSGSMGPSKGCVRVLGGYRVDVAQGPKYPVSICFCRYDIIPVRFYC